MHDVTGLKLAAKADADNGDILQADLRTHFLYRRRHRPRRRWRQLLGRGRRDARHRRLESGQASRRRAIADAADRAGAHRQRPDHVQGRDIVTTTEVRKIRGGGMAMVFRDPMTSLNPVIKIARQLAETMLVHGKLTEEQALERAVPLLGRMGITAPERAIDSYPHQFSGGMRQRVMLAMGFSSEPALLLCDEPTTALDVTMQAQILELIVELNRDFNTAIVLISHNLGVIAGVCSTRPRHVWRRGRGEGPTEEDPRRSAPPLYLGADQRGATHRPSYAGATAAGHHRGHAARPAQPAEGLPLRRALPVPLSPIERASGYWRLRQAANAAG